MPLEAEQQAMAEVERQMEALRCEVQELARWLKEDLRPELAACQKEEASMQRRKGELQDQLEALAARRQQAAEQVGHITRRQLSEIKQLTRSPPDTIRRTLIAAWMLLHSERFRGGTTIRFDEVKDWVRCQRMLADHNFITNILEFDTSALGKAPHVPRHVAVCFFGMSADDSMPDGAPDENGKETRAAGFVFPDIVRSKTLEADNSSLSPNRRATLAARPSLRRSVTGFGKPVLVKPPPLDVDTVTHACEPCGALLRWMLTLVREYIEREKLEQEMTSIDSTLPELQQKAQTMEEKAAESEATLARKRGSLEDLETGLQELRREFEAAQKAQADMKKLEAMTLKAPPKPKTGQPVLCRPSKVQVDLVGTMAHFEHQLSSLRVPFSKGAVKVLVGDVDQALVLPRLADLLKEARGSMKLVLEGHQEAAEKDMVDAERCLNVYQWLVDGALVPPGMLRVKPCGSSQGEGRCCLPQPIHELMACSGPVLPEIEAAQPGSKPGLYFDASSAALSPATRSIATAMAEYLNEEDLVARVEGHTSKDEPESLGIQRAQAVRDLFVGLGVRGGKVKPVSCKFMHPVSRLHDALNRRVEVHAE